MAFHVPIRDGGSLGERVASKTQLSSISTRPPSTQGRLSRRNAPEITSAVLVCLVRSGMSIAQTSHSPPDALILPLNAVAPPNDWPSRSKPSILLRATTGRNYPKKLKKLTMQLTKPEMHFVSGFTPNELKMFRTSEVLKPVAKSKKTTD